MKRIIILFAILAAAGLAQAQDQRDLPLDHWAYPYLERWEAEGIISLPATRPYTREDVHNALHLVMPTRTGDSIHPGILIGRSDIDERLFVRLMNELDRMEPRDTLFFIDKINIYTYDTAGIYDIHIDRLGDTCNGRDLLFWKNTKGIDLVLGIDAVITPTVLSSKSVKPQNSARSDLDAWGRFCATPTQVFLFDQRLSFIAEKEKTKTARVSSTTQTWRGAKLAIDYSYFRYANPHLSVTAGRKEFWWGQGYYGTMLLSTNAPAFDALSFKASYKRLGFESFIGILSTDQQRYFSGHRGTIQLPWHVTAGFSEVVVYKANNVDPVYANPILPFYGTQWNERDDDNILWNLDLKWTPSHGIKAWGELLMDDVQYEQNPPAPQKLGFLLGMHWADPIKLPNTDLIAEWAGTQKWVYTQRKYENRYLGSDTLSVIGHWIGTDGDALDLVLEHRFRPLLNIGLGYGWRRHGEGRIDRGLHYAGEPFAGGYAAPSDTVNGRYVGDDLHTRFLTGVVERQDLAALTLRWEPFFWATVSGKAWLGYTRNAGHVAGLGRHDGGAELSVKLDY